MDAAAAAEEIRTAPERAAAAKARAVAAERAAIDKRADVRFKQIVGLVVGTIVGGIVGFIGAVIVSLPVLLIAGLWMNDGRKGEEVANTVGYVVMGIGLILGAFMGWASNSASLD